MVDFTYNTAKISFNMHYKHKLITLEKLKEFLVSDIEKNNACTHGPKPCSNHNRCYSCPPIAPTLDKYNRENYKNCLVYTFWVDWDFKINSDNPYFKLINANRTISPYAFNYGTRLESILGGKLMIDGRCKCCNVCAKSLNKPCTFPNRRRSSLEALGIDASRLSEVILDHKIQWYKKIGDKIIEPKYISIVHGLLTSVEIEPDRIVDISINRTLW